MGYLPEPTPEMGEYHVEVRRESFYLRGEDDYEWLYKGIGQTPRHTIYVYPTVGLPRSEWDHERKTYHGGNIEILIEDIPKVIAALEQVQRVVGGNPLDE